MICFEGCSLDKKGLTGTEHIRLHHLLLFQQETNSKIPRTSASSVADVPIIT